MPNLDGVKEFRGKFQVIVIQIPKFKVSTLTLEMLMQIVYLNWSKHSTAPAMPMSKIKHLTNLEKYLQRLERRDILKVLLLTTILHDSWR